MSAPPAVRGLARACHPGPTVLVTAIATAFALAVGRGTGAVAVAAAVGAGQLSVGWSNDYLDRHRDAAIRRTDKPIAAGEISAAVVGSSAVIALVAAVLLSLISGWQATSVHAVGLASGWAYNIRLKSTLLSPLPYAIAFAALPLFVVIALPGHPWPPWWITATGALLGMGAHFANVLPDMGNDIRLGIVGLPHRLGRHTSTVATATLLIAATAILVFAPSPGPSPGGPTALLTVGLLAATFLVLLTPRRATSRAPFRLAMAVAAVNVVLFVIRGESVPY